MQEKFGRAGYRKFRVLLSRAYWVIFVRTQKTKMLIKMQKVKTRLMRFQMEMRSLLGIGIKAGKLI